MKNFEVTRLHMQRVRDYFSTLPPLRPETVDIVLRSHLQVPEALMARARTVVQQHHETTAPTLLKCG